MRACVVELWQVLKSLLKIGDEEGLKHKKVPDMNTMSAMLRTGEEHTIAAWRRSQQILADIGC